MVRRIIAATLLLAVAAGAWWWLFPDEESRIKQRLASLVEDANQAGSDVAGLASAARVSRYFTEDVTIEPGRGAAPVRGRQIIMSVAAQLKNAADSTVVSVRDVDVAVSSSATSAEVMLTATVTRNGESSDATSDVYPFALTMTKVNDEWLISQVRSNETVR